MRTTTLLLLLCVLACLPGCEEKRRRPTLSDMVDEMSERDRRERWERTATPEARAAVEAAEELKRRQK